MRTSSSGKEAVPQSLAPTPAFEDGTRFGGLYATRHGADSLTGCEYRYCATHFCSEVWNTDVEMGSITPTPDRSVEVEFELTDPYYSFVRASSEVGCRFELEGTLPREGGRYAEFFSVSDAPAARVLRIAEASDGVEPRLLAEGDTGGLFEFVVEEGCPVLSLAERGGVPTAVTSTDGAGRIVCRLPAEPDVTDVVEPFLEEHPTAELVAKRRSDRPVVPFAGGTHRWSLEDRLTDRQREVLETAYDAGYFERPRETTGEELAAELGIRPATFSQHVRAAQDNLLSALYEEDP